MTVPSNLPGAPRRHPARHLFSIAGVSALTVFIVGSFFFAATYTQGLIGANQLAAVISATLVDLTNSDRSADSLGTLSVNSKLQAAAQAKADDMAAKGYFAHVSPDGRDSWTWFKDQGYQFSYAGENLAVDFSDSKDVEEAWMNSPTHRANILNGKFTQIGIATAEGEYQGKHAIFVVQMFGRPAIPFASAPVAPKEEPAATEIAISEPAAPAPAAVLGSASPSEPVPAAAATVPAAVAAEAASPDEAPQAAPAERYSSWLGNLISSPQDALQTVYLICALIVLLALILTTELEFKKHHLRHVFAAAFLLALMGGLFTVADTLVFKAPVIGYLTGVPLG